MGGKVAVAQVSPVLFNPQATLQKVGAVTRQAAVAGAKLILFPEATIPAYPRGLAFGTVVGVRRPEGRKLFQRYAEGAVTVPGPVTEQLGETARTAGVYLVIGVIERDSITGGTLYCTILFFGPDGALLGKHRKIKPTAAERIIWGEGDGSTMPVIDTPLGKTGALICWENYMPLARMAMYAKGVQLYLAPTADYRETWQPTIRHIALEGRCYVLACNQYVTKSMYPRELEEYALLAELPEVVSCGGSAIISPMGEYLAGPLNNAEGVLYAQVDPAVVTGARFDLDVAGHYSRPDIFQLVVNEKPAEPAMFQS
jgi:nitrilase